MPVVLQQNLTLVGAPADNAPLPVASIVGQNAAEIIYRHVVNGSVAALNGIGVTTPPGYDPQSHEWGLGYDAQVDRWILVRGGPGATTYVGNGLPGVLPYIHSHPTDPALPALAAINTVAGLVHLGLNGIAAATINGLCAWHVANHFPISFVPGLSHIFPSNPDVISNYTLGADRVNVAGRRDRRPRPFPAVPVNWPAAGVEKVFPTCYVDPAGWLSTNPAHPPLIVHLGPATAQLFPNATAPGNPATDAALVQFMWAPLELRSPAAVLWAGAIQVDPAVPASGWLAAAIPPGTVDRATAAAMTGGRA